MTQRTLTTCWPGRRFIPRRGRIRFGVTNAPITGVRDNRQESMSRHAGSCIINISSEYSDLAPASEHRFRFKLTPMRGPAIK